MKEIVNFAILNTTNGNVPISLFGNNADSMDNANATTQYLWNLTGFSVTNENNVLVQYSGVNQTTLTYAIASFSGNTLQDVVDALNTLNLGSFFITTSGGNTYINNYNQNLIFSQLNIYAPSLINPNFLYGSGFDNNVLAIATQSDGKIVCGGSFTNYNGSPTNYIVRLNSDGSIDNTFLNGALYGFDSTVFSIAIQTDGKILVGGSFTTYNGIGANSIIRLNSDGTIDPTFVYGIGANGSVLAIAIQTDGKIILGGGFANYNGTLANYIIRLNTNGSVDGTFVYGTGFNISVYTIAIQTDDKILVGGNWQSYNGTLANRIIRLNTNGSVDGTFVYGTAFNAPTNSIAIQTNGRILVGGAFTSYNGTLANYIIRLNTNGSVDGTFVYGSAFDSGVNNIVTQGDTKLIVGGAFTTYNGTSANSIVRLNTNGTIDTSWNYGSGFDSAVSTLSLNSIQTILSVGGGFNNFNGTSANYIIQLLT